MLIEEGDMYNNIEDDEEFPLNSLPSVSDLHRPVPDKLQRLRDVEMVLEGAPMHKVSLFCKKTVDGVENKVLLSEYNVHAQRWNDVA